MKKFVLMLLTVLSLSSCVYTSMTRFTEKDLLWVDGFFKSDSLVFKTSDGDLDTMVVVWHKVSNEWFPVHFHIDNPVEHYYAYCYLNFDVKILSDHSIDMEALPYGGTRWGNGLFYFEKIKKDSLLLDLEINRYSSSIKVSDSLSAYVINSVKYTDCVLFPLEETSVHHSSAHAIHNVIWSRSEGLLQYEIDDGHIYYRIGR